jgi:hypothetical protein
MSSAPEALPSPWAESGSSPADLVTPAQLIIVYLESDYPPEVLFQSLSRIAPPESRKGSGRFFDFVSGEMDPFAHRFEKFPPHERDQFMRFAYAFRELLVANPPAGYRIKVAKNGAPRLHRLKDRAPRRIGARPRAPRFRRRRRGSRSGRDPPGSSEDPDSDLDRAHREVSW